MAAKKTRFPPFWGLERIKCTASTPWGERLFLRLEPMTSGHKEATLLLSKDTILFTFLIKEILLERRESTKEKDEKSSKIRKVKTKQRALPIYNI